MRQPQVGAAMLAAVDSLQAVLIVRGSAPTDEAAALAHIAAVDPSSAGVSMRQLTLVHIGGSGSGLAVHFGGNSQVLARHSIWAIRAKGRFWPQTVVVHDALYRDHESHDRWALPVHALRSPRQQRRSSFLGVVL